MTSRRGFVSKLRSPKPLLEMTLRGFAARRTSARSAAPSPSRSPSARRSIRQPEGTNAAAVAPRVGSDGYRTLGRRNSCAAAGLAHRRAAAAATKRTNGLVRRVIGEILRHLRIAEEGVDVASFVEAFVGEELQFG